MHNDLPPETRVVVAMDHGLHWGVHPGFENPEETLRTVLQANPDGVLASVALFRRFSELFDRHSSVQRIATLDLIHESTTPGVREDGEVHTQVTSVEEAARVGVDAVKVALVYGRADESVLRDNLSFAAEIGTACRAVGLPFVVEPTLWGTQITDDLNLDRLADAARISFELGADIVKSPYPGSGADFGSIAAQLPTPVYIAGGPAVDADRDVFEMAATAVEAGARGVMFGRNIWQRDQPAPMIDGLRTVVSGTGSVDEACAKL